MEKVRADKLREVKDGHDGTWVAHPALIPIAKEVRRQMNLAKIWAVPCCHGTARFPAPCQNVLSCNFTPPGV